MKEYGLIVVGSGSAMNIVDPIIQQNPDIRIAVIDKDEPGGICLTRGCIPSKIMLYPAELVRTLDEAEALGVEAEIKSVSYEKIMKRTRALIDRDIDAIRQGLSSSKNIDYYHAQAEFVAPYTMKVGDATISGKMFFLATGSRAVIPPIKGLEVAGYQTSDSVIRMEMKKLPRSIAVVGGGYIAAEFGFFLAALGSKVTVIGRNPQFLPEEEPEISALAKRVLGKHMTIVTNQEVREVERTASGAKRLVAVDRQTGSRAVVEAEEILVAAGRGPVNDILRPEKGGIKTTKDGWIQVNEYLETSQPNVWALGDADGKYLFRHVANYESEVVYYNAILKRRVKVDYHAVPHAVFTYPEVASVGLNEKEAAEKHGNEGILIGFQRYEDTAKGEAMNVRDYFVKVILERESSRILGAHIVGPHASVLIQEIINLMYTSDQSAQPMQDAIHIHPSLSEVVQRAFGSLMEPEQYHHTIRHYGLG
ncbi:MAG: dihydrolipoyl dehydrogenase [Nitrososphaerota archaeon]|nr:dihydrolipoyl dehydrogenase [Nitrososphaerota archaeon]